MSTEFLYKGILFVCATFMYCVLSQFVFVTLPERRNCSFLSPPPLLFIPTSPLHRHT